MNCISINWIIGFIKAEYNYGLFKTKQSKPASIGKNKYSNHDINNILFSIIKKLDLIMFNLIKRLMHITSKVSYIKKKDMEYIKNSHINIPISDLF